MARMEGWVSATCPASVDVLLPVIETKVPHAGSAPGQGGGGGYMGSHVQKYIS